jgi:hypothetical protein
MGACQQSSNQTLDISKRKDMEPKNDEQSEEMKKAISDNFPGASKGKKVEQIAFD